MSTPQARFVKAGKGEPHQLLFLSHLERWRKAEFPTPAELDELIVALEAHADTRDIGAEIRHVRDTSTDATDLNGVLASTARRTLARK